MRSVNGSIMAIRNILRFGQRKWRNTVFYGVCTLAFINVYFSLICKHGMCFSKKRICSHQNPMRKLFSCDGHLAGKYVLLNTDIMPTKGSARFMTLSLLPGARLGNLLFQTASLLGVANKHGYIPVLHEHFPLFEFFEITDANNTSISMLNAVEYNEKVCCIYNEQLNHLHHSKNWSLKGYFQVWKYFEQVDKRIRKYFKFKMVYRQKVDTFRRAVSREGVFNIGIHVRRGDFMHKIHEEIGYTTAPVTYFNRAIAYFKNRFNKVQFIVVSDDLLWCNDHFSNYTNLIFSPFKEPVLDLALLASCDHVIMSTGTFGWWGGWLSGGLTIYYRGYPRTGSKLMTLTNYEDYYPKNWIGID